MLLWVFTVAAPRAQKPALSLEDCINWPVLKILTVSNNGEYVIYRWGRRGADSTFVMSKDGLVRMKLGKVTNAQFTEDSRSVIVSGKQGLFSYNLLSRVKERVSDSKSFKLADHGDWLGYLDSTGMLVLEKGIEGRRLRLPKVIDFEFSLGGKSVIYQEADSGGGRAYYWLDLVNVQKVRVWQGYSVSNFQISKDDSGMVFYGASRGGKLESLWYYHVGMKEAKCVLPANELKDSACVLDGGGLTFSDDGKNIYFQVSRVPVVVKGDSAVAKVDIWRFNDEYTQEEQLERLRRRGDRLLEAKVDIEGTDFRLLERQDDRLWGMGLFTEGESGMYYLTERVVNFERRDIDSTERQDVILVNSRTGVRTVIKTNLLAGWRTLFSPHGKFVWWYDLKQKGYFVYNLKEKAERNISSGIPFAVYNEEWDQAASPGEYGTAFWIGKDDYLLLYDRYDIWKVDPTGVDRPVCITNGYGRKHKVILRCLNPSEAQNLEMESGSMDSTIILCGFDEQTKTNSFYNLKINRHRDPKLLAILPTLVYYNNLASAGNHAVLFKARDKSIFYCLEMSASSFPNIVVTDDFKNFRRLTFYQPQAQFNWIMSRLLHWKTFKGRDGEGILYVPEDFDSTKRYPVVYYFYERLADGLNKYISPDLSMGPMNIPWFVSNGYLVFCPDILYSVGDPGASACDYVLSAAEYLGKKRWIDSARMGIQGHSFGAYEVNFLVTHSRKFAAAVSAEGVSDLVSDYGSLSEGFNSGMQNFIEFHQPRMGAPLWSDKDAFIRNSPVFFADKVTTPLLLMDNKSDAVVPWGQGLEFFMGLRRLNKPAWLLQYDGQSHILTNTSDRYDYSKRMAQFFGHFLKGCSIPPWMADGIPAKWKGLKNGF